MTKYKKKEMGKSRLSSHKFVTQPLHKKRSKKISKFKLKSDIGRKGKLSNINLKALKMTQLSSDKRLNRNADAKVNSSSKSFQNSEHEGKKNAVTFGKQRQIFSNTLNSSTSKSSASGDLGRKAGRTKAVNQPSVSQQSQVSEKRKEPAQDNPSSSAPNQRHGTYVANTDQDSVIKNQHKKKKASRRQQDGASNWLNLCKTLNIDATTRKKKPLKQPAGDTSELTDTSEPKKAKTEVWFDHVDKIFIEADQDVSKDKSAGKANTNANDALVKPDSFKGLTNCVAMDCEMVGVGPRGEDSILARVSIVNHYGVCLYDKFVLPREKVTDYRTFVSGVTEANLATGEDFLKVQKEVSDIIKDRVLVGHAIHNDLKVLFLTHPHKMVRDTSHFKPFRELFNGRIPSLKKLADKVLGVSVQEGQHSSVQDAQAAMRLYTMHRKRWEKELKAKWKINKLKKKKKKML